MEWLACKNSLWMLWISYWTVIRLNEIQLQKSLKSFLTSMTMAWYLVTVLQKEIMWPQQIQGPTVWQSVLSENSSFDASEKEDRGHWSCSVWTGSIIQFEMHIMLSNKFQKKMTRIFWFFKAFFGVGWWLIWRLNLICGWQVHVIFVSVRWHSEWIFKLMSFLIWWQWRSG